ncbi:MAG: hypothetical protein EOO71_17665 [Myxococcaceae bacterium]|nr:MAG: hypothetical protein EOO71_17665 [Myxococcaceae bacterium]
MKSRFISAGLLLSLVACGDTAEDSVTTPSEAGGAPAFAPTPLRPELSVEALEEVRAQEGPRSLRALAEVERRFASRAPGLSFRIRRVATLLQGDTHVWIEQVFQGTPVKGRDLGAVVFADGSLLVHGEPDRFESVAPARMSAASTLKKVRAHVEAKGLDVREVGEAVLEPVLENRLRPGASGANAADYETVVVGFERGTPVMLAPSTSPTAPRELFVRERDGAVLERAFPPAAGMQAATLKSRMFKAPVTTLLTYQDSAGMYLLKSAKGDQVHAATQRDGTTTFPYRSATNTWGDSKLYGGQGPATITGQTAAADAFISIYATNRMFADIYKRAGWDGLGSPIWAYVHAPIGNAHAMGGGMVALGYLPSGTTLTNTPLTDIETVAHEVGHMTFEAMTGITAPVVGELGGMDEGTADIFGLVGGFYLPDAMDTAVPGCQGRTCAPTRKVITVRQDWIAGLYNQTQYGRSFIDPFQYPAWAPSIVNADSHYATGPLERMFYFLSVGVLPSGQSPADTGLLTPQRSSSFLPAGLTGIGINATNWIWYNTLQSSYFAQVNTYQGARAAMLQMTQELYQLKPHTPEYKAVEDAWAAVNVGAPADRKPPTITITTAQTSSTEATVTVDVTDDTGIESGDVTISSGIIDGPLQLHTCTSHCVFTINPTEFKSSAQHSVKVTAKDVRENEVTKSVQFQLDASPPLIATFTSNKPETWGWPIVEPRQDWKCTLKDFTGSGVAFMKVYVADDVVFEKSWSTYPSEVTIDSLTIDASSRPEGTYPLWLETGDRFGNIRKNWNRDIIVDKVAPERCELAITVDPTNNGNVTLKVTGRDDRSGLQLLAVNTSKSSLLANDKTKVVGGVERTLNATVNLPSGTHLLSSTCMDQNSNVTKTPYQTLTLARPCNTTAVAGGAQVDERFFEMGKVSGTVKLRYDTYSVHDRIQVLAGTTVIADSGCAATGDPSVQRTLTFSYSGTTRLKVNVTPNCNPVTALPTTQWAYSLSCP